MTDLTIRQLRDKLLAKELSAVELTQSHLDAIAAKDGELNSYTHVSSEYALQKAAEADKAISELGANTPMLTGIPMAMKDAICTKGIPSTAGSKMLEGFLPPYNATCFDRLEKAGGVLLGKTNTDEFMCGSSTEHSAYGPSKNPVDTSRVPGGSSGGSGSAVAAGLCQFALGTDTGGSIRLPASYCGCVGLKVSYGRVSRSGVIAFASSFDTIGPMTRSVEDAAIVLEAMAGHDSFDSTTPTTPVPKYSELLKTDLSGMTFGLPKEYFDAGINDDVKAAVMNAVEKAKELGATIKEISLPHTKYGLSVYYILAPAELSANLARYDGIRYGQSITDAKDLEDLYIQNRSQFGAEIKRRILMGTYVLSHGYYDAYYKKAQKVRRVVMNDFLEAFKDVDALLAPTAPTGAFPIGEKTDDPLTMYMNDVLTIPSSAAGVPALSIPCGSTADGLPVGLQIIGPHYKEEVILGIGHALETALS